MASIIFYSGSVICWLIAALCLVQMLRPSYKQVFEALMATLFFILIAGGFAWLGHIAP